MILVDTLGFDDAYNLKDDTKTLCWIRVILYKVFLLVFPTLRFTGTANENLLLFKELCDGGVISWWRLNGKEFRDEKSGAQCEVQVQEIFLISP